MKWFHRRPKALSAAEALEAEFNEVMRKVNEATPDRTGMYRIRRGVRVENL
jgi:hypothetical protein